MGISNKCRKCQCVHRPPFDDFCPSGADPRKVSGTSADGSQSGPTVNIEIPAETYADLTKRLQKLEEHDREIVKAISLKMALSLKNLNFET